MAAPRKFIVVGNFDKEVSVNDIDRLCNILRTGSLNPGTDIVIGCPSHFHNYALEHLPRNVGIAAHNSFQKEDVRNDQSCISFPIVIPNYPFSWVLLENLDQEPKGIIVQRVMSVMEADLKMIACLTLPQDDRLKGHMQTVISVQLQSIADAISDWSRVVIALQYQRENNNDVFVTNNQVQEALSLVRAWLVNNVSENVANATRIIYSGSVSSSNCNELAKLKDLDGFLVGNSALNFDFLQLANASRSSHTCLLMKHQQIKATSQMIHGLREEYFQFKSLQRKRCPKRYI